MNIFSSKPKVPKAPYFTDDPPPSNPQPRQSSLRTSKSASNLAYTATEQRRSSRVKPPVPDMPKEYVRSQSSYQREPLRGDRNAVYPGTVTRQLTPPNDWYEDPSDQPPEDDSDARTVNADNDQWMTSRAYAPTPEPVQPTAPLALPGQSSSSSRPSRRGAPHTRVTRPATPANPNVPAPMSPLSEAPSPPVTPRKPLSSPGLARPAPLNFAAYAPPVQIQEMRAHTEQVPGQPNVFQIQLRFQIRVGDAITVVQTG